MEQNGFTINPLKCQWGVKETDWLGYWLMPKSLKPWTKKVNTILKMRPPTNVTKMHTFVGMVMYYRDMCPRSSHILAPSTKLSGLPKRSKLKWTDEVEVAFKQMNAVIAEDEIMAYLDHNQRVLRWRCLIKEYSPKIFYLDGKCNVLEDVFSRLPKFDDPTSIEGKNVGSLNSPDLLDTYHAV